MTQHMVKQKFYNALWDGMAPTWGYPVGQRGGFAVVRPLVSGAPHFVMSALEWQVIHVRSGLRVGLGKNKKEAIEDANNALRRAIRKKGAAHVDRRLANAKPMKKYTDRSIIAPPGEKERKG